MNINGVGIEKVSNARFLGIWIDDELKLKQQYDILHKKLTDSVRALVAVRTALNYETKLLIYHSLFQSHASFCSMSYFDKLNKSQVDGFLSYKKKQ